MKLNSANIRNIIFGAEDSLVSTVGVLFGVASTTEDKSILITTGIIVIAVESISMGAGAFLAEKAEDETLNNTSMYSQPKLDALFMFSSYFVAGFIPLAPYYFLDPNTAKLLSVVLTGISLFILGFVPGKKVKSGIRMVIIGGLAILTGFVIGSTNIIK